MPGPLLRLVCPGPPQSPLSQWTLLCLLSLVPSLYLSCMVTVPSSLGSCSQHPQYLNLTWLPMRLFCLCPSWPHLRLCTSYQNWLTLSQCILCSLNWLTLLILCPSQVPLGLNRTVLSDPDAPEAEHLLLLPDPEPESAELSELAILGRMYPEPKLTVPELILPVPATPVTVLRTWPQDRVLLHYWASARLLESVRVCCRLPPWLPAHPPNELCVCSRLPASEWLRLRCWSSALLRCRSGPGMVPCASYVLHGFLLLNFFRLCNPGVLNLPY